jgi:hypothetical protein
VIDVINSNKAHVHLNMMGNNKVVIWVEILVEILIQEVRDHNIMINNNSNIKIKDQIEIITNKDKIIIGLIITQIVLLHSKEFKNNIQKEGLVLNMETMEKLLISHKVLVNKVDKEEIIQINHKLEEINNQINSNVYFAEIFISVNHVNIKENVQGVMDLI